MNLLTAPRGHTRIRPVLAALAVGCLALALAATAAKAAPNPGDDFNAEFNYAGLAVAVAGTGIDQLVLEPPATPLKLQGKYKDAGGNFTLPKATGLDFPKLSVPVAGVATVDGEIDLADDATGTYDESTGRLDLNAKISLVLGVDDMAALPAPLNGLGTGPLKCTFSPLDVAFSTDNGWPHKGKSFTDRAGLKDGAIAGAWRYKPDVVSADPSKQFLCDTIGGMLDSVGGLWLANSTTPVAAMPDATQPKPAPLACSENEIGIYPNCEAKTAAIGSLSLTKKLKVKAGKKGTLKLTASNTGNSPLTVTVKVKSSNRQVKATKRVTLDIPAASSASAKIRIKAGKKAKGKARITATAEGKTARSVVTVTKAKKKPRRK